jgi:hypothetical protein
MTERNKEGLTKIGLRLAWAGVILVSSSCKKAEPTTSLGSENGPSTEESLPTPVEKTTPGGASVEEEVPIATPTRPELERVAEGGPFTPEQYDLIYVQEKYKGQEEQLTRWVKDYWGKANNAPFHPGSTELNFKYFFDENDDEEAIVLLEAGGEDYQGATFTKPFDMAKGKLMDEPPPAPEGEFDIPEGLGPLRVSGGDYTLANVYGELARIDGNGEVVQMINDQGQWEEVLQPEPTESIEEQVSVEIPQFLKEKWKSMGYLEPLNEGGGYETKGMEINGEMREFLVWRLGFTEFWVDKELIKMEADFSEGGHKFIGVTIVPNYKEEGAVENIEKLGAWVHAINLGLVDRTSSKIDPTWYQRYLQYITDNPDASYELEGYVLKQEGAYEIANLGKVSAELPKRFVFLKPVIERSVAMEGPKKILGGSDDAPFELDYVVRSSGYLGLDIDDEGRLTSLQSGYLIDGKLGGRMSGGAGIYNVMIMIASAESYYRSALVSFAPAPDLKIYSEIYASYFSDPVKGERSHVTWDYP